METLFLTFQVWTVLEATVVSYSSEKNYVFQMRASYLGFYLPPKKWGNWERMAWVHNRPFSFEWNILIW